MCVYSGLRLNEINGFYCFVKGIPKRTDLFKLRGKNAVTASTVLPLPQFVLRYQGLHHHGFWAPSAKVNMGKEADNGLVSLQK